MEDGRQDGGIVLPAPTAWPMILAFGITLIGAGYLMHPLLAVVGGAAVLAACVGWFREVLPVEHEEAVPLVEQGEAPVVEPSPRRVLALPGVDTHRMRLPLEVYPYSVGLKAGLAGGAAMAIVACLFGIISHRSPWYPINLLAAAGSSALTHATEAELARFSRAGLVLASVVHASLSILVGVLYAALLPMFGRRPVLTGGFIVPVLMTAITWSLLRVVNPLLNDRIQWGWFIGSQIAFGVVAGWVASRTERVPTSQSLPLAMRAGFEGTGLPRAPRDVERQ
jgi:hypothetical protein